MPDREKVLKEFEKICGYTLRSHEFQVLNDVLVLLKEQNDCENCTIAIEDRQPVVRCRDCKHQDPDRFDDGEGNYVCRKGHGWKPDDWFCADGERR